MKTIITGCIALIFIVSHTLFLYNLAIQTCDLRIMTLWNYYSLGFIIFSIWIIEWASVDTFLQESLINGSKLLILLVFADILLTNHGFTKQPYYNLILFMLGSGAAITILLIELIKTNGKKWLLLAITLFILFLYFLRAFVVPLILKQHTEQLKTEQRSKH